MWHSRSLVTRPKGRGILTTMNEPRTRQVVPPQRLRPARRRRSRAAAWTQYAALRAAIFVCGVLPDSAAYALARVLGRAGWLHARFRRTALANVRKALGASMTDNEIVRIARAAFFHLALSAIESARSLSTRSGPQSDRFEVAGLDHFEAAAEQGKGIIILTGHLGNWETCGGWFSCNVHRIAAIARRQPNPWINRLVMRYRQRTGLTILPKHTPPAVIRSFLADRCAVAFLADQYGGASGVEVTFFGMRTTAPRGPMVYALRTGAPVVPIFAVRSPGRHFHHRICIAPPLGLARTGHTARDVRVNTQKGITVLESYIRRHPEQWLWMHRRWR